MFCRIIPRRIFAAAAALGACSIFTSPALAGHSASDAPSVTVSVADLDLNRDAGAHAALQRIRLAAGEVCGEAPSIKDIARNAIYRDCVNRAVENSVRALGAARATALLHVSSKPYRLAERR